jgi:hypothetical protein
MAVFRYETYLRVNAAQRLMELSQREKQLYKSEAYRRCGHGLTAAQFDEVVQGLAEESDPWLKVEQGALGATVLTYID